MADQSDLHPDPARRPYLGMAAGELADQWYAKYWSPVMAPLPSHITEALSVGAQAPPLGLSLDDAGTLAENGYQQLENGYSVIGDGSIHIATLTLMPRVSPAMIDWWIWWHTLQTRRYKLWHPQAHLYAEWADNGVAHPTSDRERYIGGTSFVDEYVGSAVGELAIQFMHPKEFGFHDDGLEPDVATAICARVGLSRVALDWGYLVHLVRTVDGGAEMRSRFWMGGEHVAARGGAALEGELTSAADAVRNLGESEARAMVVHCAREMNHLAAFLPEMFHEFTSGEEGVAS